MTVLWRRTIRRFDLLVCRQDLSLTHLNWKGRIIERLISFQKRLISIQPVVVESVGSIRADAVSVSVDIKGTLKRMWPRLRRVRLGLLAGAAIATINAVCFSAYWLAYRLRRRRHVRSVLQFSIVSHKPYMLSRVLRRLGVKSDFFAVNVGVAKGILDVGWDYSLPSTQFAPRRRLLEVFYLWTVLARYDVIHSHFKTLLSHTGWELEYLRRLGKVLVFHYRGCDIRHRSLNMRIQPVLNCCQECDYPVGSCDTDYQHSQVAITTKYGDLFFVTTPDLIDFVPSAEHIPFIHPIGVDLAAIEPAPRPANVFRVVTSSNHPGIDGSRFIQAAVRRLRAEGRAVELIEVSSMPYAQALAVYKSADVYVGKLRMGYYNNANIETMMLGVPNMSHIRDEFRSIVPDCPIIQTTPDEVYERLNYYIDRPDELRAIGARGPAFVRAHHDPIRIVSDIVRRYNQALADKRTRGTTRREPHAEPTIPLLRRDMTPIRPSVRS